jgi:hypothetical protein
MTGIFLAIVLFAAASIFRKIIGQRPISTPQEPRVSLDRVDRYVPREMSESEIADEPAFVVIDPARTLAPPDYIPNGRPSAGALDATVAMMEMMCGPGVCTPRNH